MKYDSRSQIITKLKMKATNNCPVRYNLVNILLILTFSSGFKALELAFPFLGDRNDNEAVVCSTEPRRYMQDRKDVMTVLAEF